MDVYMMGATITAIHVLYTLAFTTSGQEAIASYPLRVSIVGSTAITLAWPVYWLVALLNATRAG